MQAWGKDQKVGLVSVGKMTEKEENGRGMDYTAIHR